MSDAVKPSSVPAGTTYTRASAFVTQNAPRKPPPKLLGPPMPISPLIRFSRWSALILGVTYGVYHNRHLVKKEERLHEIEERKRPAREAAAAKVKAYKTREEMLTLAREVGVPVPADFEDQFRTPDVVVVNTHGKH